MAKSHVSPVAEFVVSVNGSTDRQATIDNFTAQLDTHLNTTERGEALVMQYLNELFDTVPGKRYSQELIIGTITGRIMHDVQELSGSDKYPVVSALVNNVLENKVSSGYLNVARKFGTGRTSESPVIVPKTSKTSA